MKSRIAPALLAVALAPLAAGCGDDAPRPGTVAATHAVGDVVPFVLSRYDGGKETSTALEVTVLGMRRGTPDDLADFDMGADADATPYYVRVRFRNTDDAALTRWSFPDPLGADLDSGAQARQIVLTAPFPACTTPRTTTLAPGATLTGCAIFVAPRGRRVTTVLGNSDGTALQTWNLG